MEFLVFVLLICVFILYVNYTNLKKEVTSIHFFIKKHFEENRALKKEIDELKKTVEGKTISNQTPLYTIEETKTQEIEAVTQPTEEAKIDLNENIIHDPEKSAIQEQSSISSDVNLNPNEAIIEEPILHFESQAIPRLEKEIVREEKVYQESAFSKFIKKVEKQFADNWTGILGTGIMVLGIGYLSIYTALKVSPFFRILLVWAYAGLLVGSHYILKKKEKWATTGLWLRSAGASLFLFGCYGASQIPALSFISNTYVSYLLIAVGIALNLFIGYSIKKQTFLSLHVILSLLILCVIPEKTITTFILASATASIGIILSYKEKWEYHLLVVIIAFIVFVIWFNGQGTTLSSIQNKLAIIGITIVAASCMFMQYRSIYENTFFEKAAFITHLTNWALFATGLILHSTGSKFKTLVLFGAAICCLIIALKARKKKIYWLYHVDGIVAFILLGLSVIMLNDLKVGVDSIACVLYILIVTCLLVVYKEKEVLLHKIFLGINHVGSLILLIFSSLLLSHSIDSNSITNSTLSFLLLSLIAVGVPVFSSIKKEFLEVDSFIGNRNLSINGLISILLFIFLIIDCYQMLQTNYYYLVFIGIALLWLGLRMKFKSSIFDIGRTFFFIASVLVGNCAIVVEDISSFNWFFAIGIMIITIGNWNSRWFYKNEFIIRFIAIMGINILLLLLSFRFLNEHPFYQILSFLGIAIINHEFLWINYKRNSLTSDNQTFLYISYYVITILSSLLLLIHCFILNNLEIGLTCIVFSVVEVYALFAKRIRNNSNDTIKEWNNFNLFNSELLLFNSIMFGFSCLQTEYQTVFFSLLCVISFICFAKFYEFKRYLNYSFLLLIGCVILSTIQAIEHIDTVNKTLLYITQTATILISARYCFLLQKSTKEESKFLSNIAPYLLNFWVIVTLYFQVEIAYLPIIIMSMALFNMWLIYTNKLKIELLFVSTIALLAILFSVYYCFDTLNSFTLIDWVLQLGSVIVGIIVTVFINKKQEVEALKSNYQIVLNVWLSLIMFSQLEHKWLPVFWASTAILNLYLYSRKVSFQKNVSIVYYLLANLHLGFLSFSFYEDQFLAIYLFIFFLLGVYIFLAYKWIEEFKLKNSLLIYPATLSIGCFLYLTFDRGVLTFFWILEALGLLILGILLKEKYFRYVSLSLVGLCVIRLLFFDLSNTNFLIRALVLLGVGIVLLLMNSLFKKYKDRFD